MKRLGFMVGDKFPFFIFFLVRKLPRETLIFSFFLFLIIYLRSKGPLDLYLIHYNFLVFPQRNFSELRMCFGLMHTDNR